MAEGKSYAQIEPSFFFHDDRFTRLSAQHKLIYLGYWMTARELQREILSPGFGEHEVSKRVEVSKYCAKTFKLFIINLKKFNPEPLLEFSPEGYIRVCGVRSKHKKLRAWHDAEDEALTEKFFPTGEERRGEERKGLREEKNLPDDVESQAAELQAEINGMTVSKQSPIRKVAPSKYTVHERAVMDFWDGLYKQVHHDAYSWAGWDAKNVTRLLERNSFSRILTCMYYLLVFSRDRPPTIKELYNNLSEYPDKRRNKWESQWRKCQKYVEEYREMNPSLFQTA